MGICLMSDRKFQKNDIVLLDDVRIQLANRQLRKHVPPPASQPRVLQKRRWNPPRQGLFSPAKRPRMQSSSGPQINGRVQKVCKDIIKYAAPVNPQWRSRRPLEMQIKIWMKNAEAMQPKFGKSLSHSAGWHNVSLHLPNQPAYVNQPHDNPANKAKRNNLRNKPKDE